MTKELIEEARRQVGHIEDKSKRERLISDLADALAARQPSEEDREAVEAEATIRWGTFASTDTRQGAFERDAFVEGANWALSRAAVRDAATESDAEALENALDDVTHQRDAALAAVERVAALASRAQTFGADEFGAFKRELLAALDGAPEPEVKP